MKVLFDHCVPRPFRKLLPGCNISTAREAGLDAVANGELLTAAEARFTVLITSDQNLRHQQTLRSRKLAIIVLPTNDLSELRPLASQVLAALANIQPGALVEIPRR